MISENSPVCGNDACQPEEMWYKACIVGGRSRVKPRPGLSTFTLPVDALTLSFKIRLTTAAGGTTEPGEPPDSFQAVLLDESFNPLFSVGSFFDAFYSIDGPETSPRQFYNPKYVSVTDPVDGWRQVTLNLSSLASQELLIEFALFGQDDGLTSEIALDVVVTLQTQDGTIPEPGALAVWAGIFLVGLPWVRRRSLRRQG